jgi:hypothetical protein
MPAVPRVVEPIRQHRLSQLADDRAGEFPLHVAVRISGIFFGVTPRTNRGERATGLVGESFPTFWKIGRAAHVLDGAEAGAIAIGFHHLRAASVRDTSHVLIVRLDMLVHREKGPDVLRQ